MTHPPLDAWRLPSRLPQHAAPVGFASPGRRRAHQALRLFVAAGTWAAGLCLVIGSVVLVATAAGPEHDAGLRATSQRTSVTAGRSDPPIAMPYRQVALFTGRGGRITRRFWVTARVPWHLQWSYSCPRGRNGQLVVEDTSGASTGTTGLGASISDSGAAGHGTTRFDPSGRSHYLIVLSSCNWTMKVMQSR